MTAPAKETLSQAIGTLKYLTAVAENQPYGTKNRMTSSLRPHADAIRAFIASPPAGGDARFDELALALFAFQFGHNPGYRALCPRQGTPAEVRHWRAIPAAPAAAFKELELTVLPPGECGTVFHSSGTTGQQPSRHWHNAESLELYAASLLAWAEPHLRLRADGLRQFCSLTPPPSLAPRSSLVCMLETIRRAHEGCTAAFHGGLDADGGWGLDVAGLRADLCRAISNAQPVALFGTAFNFVHLLDGLGRPGQQLELPAGSRIMETGGYKGRSRSISRPELHRALSQALGVRPEFIVTEYGMSELSSQAYNAVAGRAAPRVLRFPPWARALVVSPETGAEVPEGATGLLRIVDLANVASVLAIQTEDLAVRRGDGFELLGRAAASEPRGCSLLTA